MSVFNEHAASGMPQADAVERILGEFRARRERAQNLIARQSELLARLRDRLHDAPATTLVAPAADADLSGIVQELSRRQELWQQRHSEDLQRHESLLDAVSEQLFELAAQLTATEHPRTASSRPTATPAVSAPQSNWEQAKQRLLQELENGESPPEPAAEEAPAVARSSRRALEELVAQRDQEIADLRRQLAAAPPPPAESSVLNDDEVVQRERANLRRLQEEWQEKLKKAEIDISIERAKLARERTQLEERLQVLQREAAGGGKPGSDTPGKANRNRWLSRLGLLEE